MPQHANVRDGGTSVHGISRAYFNKLVGMYYREGMRKPAQNGNPGKLELSSSSITRHFLGARWRDPDDQNDVMVLQQMFAAMRRHEVDNCVAVLREFCISSQCSVLSLKFRKWRLRGEGGSASPAGCGGDRFNVRPAQVAGLDTVDVVPRKRRFEANRAEDERWFATDDNDGCDDDDSSVSMRSTVVRAPISRPNTLRHRGEPSEPVDKVQALHGPYKLIQAIGENNIGSAAWSSHGESGVHPASSTASSHSLSSAALLSNLFRQVAEQTTHVSAFKTQSVLSSQAKVLPLMVSATGPSLASLQAFTSIPATKYHLPACVANGRPFHGITPSRDDVMYSSSGDMQQVRAKNFCGGQSASAPLAESLLSSIKMSSSTLPPFKHVLQACLQ